MESRAAGVAGSRYRAFVSYSHADSTFAEWLHRKLESTKLPGAARLAPIFIDRAELAAGPDLSMQVRQALAESAALIVVSSPAARASRWVNQEIELFRQLAPDKPILAALISGEPEDAFPQAILAREGQPVEPLAADFRAGQDGKRLGLLKLVAGLTSQPLDQLVQRDALSRQRRVMAVTAASALLSLVLAALLVVAVRARSEAERQRAEAEGMVEFMLTDLRTRLIGVGRLDVMQAVNARALGYYGNQTNLDGLAPESLDRRARVIEAMGEDDENLGRIEAAYAKYLELDRVTAALLQKDPRNPDRIFAHARSQNRLALIETTKGELNSAYPRFANAQRLLNLVPKQERSSGWSKLYALISGNLCAIGVKTRADSSEVLAHCRQAIDLTESWLRLRPADKEARYELAMHYNWQGSAWEAAGDLRKASESMTKSLKISDSLVNDDPKNMRWHEQHMELSFAVAMHALKHKQRLVFNQYIIMAEMDAEMLVKHDPSNSYWSDFRKKVSAIKKENFK